VKCNPQVVARTSIDDRSEQRPRPHPQARPLCCTRRGAFTVIGDTVNMTSRIESMTKQLNAPILVSESVVAILPGGLLLGEPTQAQLKGRNEPVLIYP